MKRRYPLEPLRTVHERDKREAASELTRSTERRREAERAEAERIARGRALDAAHRATVAAEEERLDRGAARPADLERLAHFRDDGAAQARERARSERTAASVTESARRAEREAMTTLQHAHAREQALSRHRASFRATQAAQAEQRADDEAADVHGSRRREKERDR